MWDWRGGGAGWGLKGAESVPEAYIGTRNPCRYSTELGIIGIGGA